MTKNAMQWLLRSKETKRTPNYQGARSKFKLNIWTNYQQIV